ncbi:phage adaptor protein [Rhizobium skierniewicense]|uniref:phage adaptor protein n=1 Tax=Rhizobium skierniewicense TaxID=984260 RepID=UPI0015720812|nr:hypothetical protein [Rhizobium skierniewicense]NTF34254.1 hypothetical protein [Rhizobium skierniewicense]
MAITDYNSLIEAVEEYTLRYDMPVAMFVGLAESKFRPIISHYNQDKTVVLPIVGGKITLPADFLEAQFIRVNDYETRQISLQGGERYADEVAYVQAGNTYEFDGPVDISTAKLIYRAAIPALTADAPTNWLIQKFPEVYLHAVLGRAYRWLKDMESFGLEEQSFKEAVALVALDDIKGRSTANVASYGGA